MSTDQILKSLAEKPGQIASELGTTTVEMNKLAAAGKVIALGTRSTGKPGRPPVEWAVAGTAAASEESDDNKAVQKAQAKRQAWRTFNSLSVAIDNARKLYGTGSEEHEAAKQARRDAFPDGYPQMPSKNDYDLTGGTNTTAETGVLVAA
jgi:hypothetical protein